MRLYFRMAVPLFAAVMACMEPEGDIDTVTLEELPSSEVSWEEYRDQALAAGGGDFYRVEWDLAFASEEELRAYYDEQFGHESEKLGVFRRISNGYEPIFSRVDRLDIVYCVSPLFTNHSTVVADMAAATLGWQRLANVRFRYDPTQNASCDWNNNNVDFAVMPTILPMQGCGVSKLVWAPGGCPLMSGGTLIQVRGVLFVQYATIPGPPPLQGITAGGLLTHELGHILGFSHEHIWGPGSCEDLVRPDLDRTARHLTTYDPLSAMQYPRPECGGTAGSDYRFSRLDGIGARQVYKMPAAWHVPLRAL